MVCIYIYTHTAVNECKQAKQMFTYNNSNSKLQIHYTCINFNIERVSLFVCLIHNLFY